SFSSTLQIFFSFSGCAATEVACGGAGGVVTGAWAIITEATNINDIHVSPEFDAAPQSREISIGQWQNVLNNQRFRAGPTSARMIPRTAFTSREDQPVLVKIVRRVFLVASVRDGGWK